MAKPKLERATQERQKEAARHGRVAAGPPKREKNIGHQNGEEHNLSTTRGGRRVPNGRGGKN